MTSRISRLMAWISPAVVFLLLAAAMLTPGEALAQRGGAANNYWYRQPPIQQPVYRPPPPITYSPAYRNTLSTLQTTTLRSTLGPSLRTSGISGANAWRTTAPSTQIARTLGSSGLSISRPAASALGRTATSIARQNYVLPKAGSVRGITSAPSNRLYALSASGVRPSTIIAAPKASGNYAMPRVTTNLSSAKAAQLRARVANRNGGGNGGGNGKGGGGSSFSAKIAKASANLRASQTGVVTVPPSASQKLSQSAYAVASKLAGNYTPGVSRLYRASDVPHFRTKWNGNSWAKRGGSRKYHFDKHGSDFGAKSMRAYSRMALQFRNKPPAGTLIRTGLKDGDWALYHQKSNTLMILTKKGQIKTFYKPSPLSAKNPKGWEGGYKSNLDYFERGIR